MRYQAALHSDLSASPPTWLPYSDACGSLQAGRDRFSTAARWRPASARKTLIFNLRGGVRRLGISAEHAVAAPSRAVRVVRARLIVKAGMDAALLAWTKRARALPHQQRDRQAALSSQPP